MVKWQIRQTTVNKKVNRTMPSKYIFMLPKRVWLNINQVRGCLKPYKIGPRSVRPLSCLRLSLPHLASFVSAVGAKTLYRDPPPPCICDI